MTDKLKQIIKEEVVKLPKEKQEAIDSFDWVSISENIGKKYLLSEDEINDLQTETLLILVGLENPNLYALNIENNVGTSKNEAEKIVEEVNQRRFTPISNLFVENVKNSGKVKNAGPKQTLDFILSGGDYSAFIEQKKDSRETESEETVVPVFSIKEENLKSKFKI